jgi:crotonobetainyl-CoA:carnitine CoA-transferase CaiB-like acyl-CoA transferase
MAVIQRQANGAGTEAMTGPLEDVVILDLTQQLAGPGGTMLLGDMGATVIRVEPPPHQAVHGALPSAMAPGENNLRRTDLNLARSKRSIALDLNKPEAREIVYAIARRADVVCQNYRPGVADRLGMDLESFRKVKPDIIYSCVSAYGDLGPESFRPGFDIIAQSGAGSMVAGPDGSMPRPVAVPIGDVTAFCLETLGVVAALYHRRMTGEGQSVSTSMLAGALLQSILRLTTIDEVDREGRQAQLERARELVRAKAPYAEVLSATASGLGGQLLPALPVGNPVIDIYYRVYRTRDGYVAVGCLNVGQQRRLNAALELGDPRFKPDATPESLASEAARRTFAHMKAKAEGRFAEHSCVEMLRLLEAQDVACGPVRNLLETFDDQHLLENRYLVEHQHPTAGKTTVLGHPIRFEKTPMRIKHPAEPAGARGEEILSWLGFSPAEIQQLCDRQVAFL